MFRLRHYLKVFWTIVVSDVVDMMHDLVSFQFAPEILLHYKSVFQHTFSFADVDTDVSVFHFASTTAPDRRIFAMSKFLAFIKARL
jgi:hypothetical protein